jgi:hypothetical protein
VDGIDDAGVGLVLGELLLAKKNNEPKVAAIRPTVAPRFLKVSLGVQAGSGSGGVGAGDSAWSDAAGAGAVAAGRLVAAAVRAIRSDTKESGDIRSCF